MILSLLTDYGDVDDFVGVCHGVIRRIHPSASIIDLTHGVPRHDIRHGAVVLRNALPFLPAGVHVGVVDPEVGSERRAIAVRCHDGRLLVGPDNGLLSLAWERFGGVVEAVDVSRSRHRLEPVSASFHGRDLFSPVAAHLAAGAELVEAGDRLDPEELAMLELPRPRIEAAGVTAHALLIDSFGNVGLDVRHDELHGIGLALGRAAVVEAGGVRREATFVRSFADVPAGGMLVYEDAYRSLAVAVNRGNAAVTLGVGRDDEIRIVAR